MITSPPPVSTTPAVPSGLSVAAGLVGICIAIGAGSAGFVSRIIAARFLGFPWDGLFQVAAIAAVIGAVLALMQSPAGCPIIAGAAVAVAVGVTVTTRGFILSEFLDAYPLRGLLYLGAGFMGGVGVVLGLLGLRGRGRSGPGVVSSLLALGVLGCHAGVFQLDEFRESQNIRPLLGVGAIVAVMIVGSFVGRFGPLAAAAGAACLFPVYNVFTAIDGYPRGGLAVAASLALGAIIMVSVATVVAASRQPTVATFQTATGYDPSGYGTPAYGTAAYGAATYGASNFGAPTYGTPVAGTPIAGTPDYNQPADLPPIAEVTTVSTAGLFGSDPVTLETPAATTNGAQWAADPYRRHELRYWDGDVWTQHVSDSGVSSSDPV